jgi:hypothetical protein
MEMEVLADAVGMKRMGTRQPFDALARLEVVAANGAAGRQGEMRNSGGQA